VVAGDAREVEVPFEEPRQAAEAEPRGTEEEDTMKWGGYNRKGEERMKKLFSGKVLYYVMTFAALALLLAESIKWSPETPGK